MKVGILDTTTRVNYSERRFKSMKNALAYRAKLQAKCRELGAGFVTYLVGQLDGR